MKFLLLSILLIVSLTSNAQNVVQKYVRVACECAKNQDYAAHADKLKNAGSTEKERLIYSFLKEEYLTTIRCIITETSKILTEEDKNEFSSKEEFEEAFFDALSGKCPDVAFIFATFKRIDSELFDENVDKRARGDFRKIRKISESGNIDSTFTMWNQFSDNYGSENTFMIDFIAFAYANNHTIEGNLKATILIEGLQHGKIADYRFDSSVPLNDFLVNSLLALAKKYEQQEIINAIQEVKLPKE